MEFTPLHQAFGAQPGPLSSETLEDAIAAGSEESDQLDWKTELPPEKVLSQSDVIKDIAALANSGGGVLVLASPRKAPGRKPGSTSAR